MAWLWQPMSYTSHESVDMHEPFARGVAPITWRLANAQTSQFTRIFTKSTRHDPARGLYTQTLRARRRDAAHNSAPHGRARCGVQGRALRGVSQAPISRVACSQLFILCLFWHEARDVRDEDRSPMRGHTRHRTRTRRFLVLPHLAQKKPLA